MALAISIKINGKDIRDKWGLEILSCDNLDTPPNDLSAFVAPTRDGGVPGISNYKPRDFRMIGEFIDPTGTPTRSTALALVDDLKEFLSPKYDSMRQVRIDFADLTDRYYLARLKSIRLIPIQPRYTSTRFRVEIVFQIDNPFGIYNTLTLSNITAFASPFSTFVNHSGKVPTRPRIRIENTSGTLTSLSLYNLAIRHRTRNIATTTSGLKWVSGRWADVKGAIHFDGAGTLSFPTLGNFNPNRFTFGCWFRPTSLAATTYIFSTTGDVIKCYYEPAAGIRFDINGTVIVISDATSGLATDEWFLIVCSYDSSTMRLNIYDLDAGTWSSVSDTVSYSSIPTNTYLGATAAGASQGNKYLDDIRFINRVLTGFDGVTPSEGSEKDIWEAALAPLPMDDGMTAYFPFDCKTDGIAWENTLLTITETVAANSMLEIDCENHRAFIITATPAASPSSIMDNVSGEFPFLLPGFNGIQVVHNATNITMAIEDKRRFV